MCETCHRRKPKMYWITVAHSKRNMLSFFSHNFLLVVISLHKANPPVALCKKKKKSGPWWSQTWLIRDMGQEQSLIKWIRLYTVWSNTFRLRPGGGKACLNLPLSTAQWMVTRGGAKEGPCSDGWVKKEGEVIDRKRTALEWEAWSCDEIEWWRRQLFPCKDRLSEGLS